MRQLLTSLYLLMLAGLAQAGLDVSTRATPGSLPLDGVVIVGSPSADPLEAFVTQDLAGDLTRLGLRTATQGAVQIWVGTAGRHAQIDAQAERLGLGALKGCWECFRIAVLRDPAPGVKQALVIAGADLRGTAYGVYTLSQALGVSPWVWWADLAPRQRGPLHLSLSEPLQDGPAVKYRGLFINDEDWGLHPWAANTFEPEARNIGPKTYEQVFRLLLRLKANTLWPAMHQVSRAFNDNPKNAELAQRYGIVMGSSHAEPLLRNNVSEWTAPHDQYNYATHPQQVRDYWAERLKTNGRYESLFTLGMRGIHDSGMQGGGTVAEKQALLNGLIADQRELIRQHVGDPTTTPQIFVPYKEVLPLLPGLALPDDVTLVWPDDNFGYIRQFPDAAQSRRSGGSGIYYHLSYLGAPLSYLWLDTTPPALVAEEMGRAFEAGARQLWVVNAGDIKPHEVNLSHWFDLAWNPAAVRAQGQGGYLRELAQRLFGVADISDIWDGHYRVNFERRPEHLQFHLAGERMKRSGWPLAAVHERLNRFATLLARLDAVRPRVAAAQQAAFFQLVEYPVRASALANERFFALERYAATLERDPAGARAFAAQAVRADQRLKALTARYNAGRWAGILAEEPADGLWTSYRQIAPLLPAPGLGGSAPDALTELTRASADLAPLPLLEPVAPALRVTDSAAWRRVPGLGRGDGVLAARQPGATLEIAAPGTAPGPSCLRVHVLPSYTATPGEAWAADVLVDGQTLPLRWPRGPQDAAWAQGVLNNRLQASVTLPERSGPLKLQLRAQQRDLMFDGAELLPGACKTHP
ncbi:glycosyl hydrolase 115 family protein [Pelomonas sp. UHG3]|uniref:Glycosyl hydrolase 115 family protein n=1 Tax=Roseateles hydrophilus TaxID=2975054 RepID=A0ACC6C4U7_9BURK|nr:glycosyl hydrolase 115 family protein [Pelomonas sp. UHG3]MCY4743417.1 glycosyl hydrolase 115 family protein [Pelomonas sp. UHG3]